MPPGHVSRQNWADQLQGKEWSALNMIGRSLPWLTAGWHDTGLRPWLIRKWLRLSCMHGEDLLCENGGLPSEQAPWCSSVP
jgi:hypothetical protein